MERARRYPQVLSGARSLQSAEPVFRSLKDELDERRVGLGTDVAWRVEHVQPGAQSCWLPAGQQPHGGAAQDLVGHEVVGLQADAQAAQHGIADEGVITYVLPVVFEPALILHAVRRYAGSVLFGDRDAWPEVIPQPALLLRLRGTLVLLASARQMREVHAALAPELREAVLV